MGIHHGRLIVACGAGLAIVGAVAACSFLSTEEFSGGNRAGESDSGNPDGGTTSPGPDGSGPPNDGSTIPPNNGYRAAVMADGPIGYWRLGDSVAPTARDEISGGHDGTYIGGPKLGSAGAVAGDPDTAVEFDGSDDRVSITLPSQFDFAGKVPFSVEAWAKRTATGNGVLSKGIYDGGYDGWFLVYNGTGGSTFQFFRSGSTSVSTAAPADNAWFHAVATFDGLTLLLFINGVQVASNANQKDLNATGAPLVIGRPANWGTHTGPVDEVAVYDKPLPPARVKAHYDAAQGK